MRRRPSMAPVVLGGLATAGLAAIGARQPWATASGEAPALRTAEAAGSDVAPVVLPLALVSLAAWAALLVLRRRGRRLVSALGAAAAATAAIVSLGAGPDAAEVATDLLGDAADTSVTTSAWPWITVVGALLSAVAFIVAWRAASRWPEMSSRYDSPAAEARRGSPATAVPAEPGDPQGTREPSSSELWKALDEGRDPTV